MVSQMCTVTFSNIRLWIFFFVITERGFKMNALMKCRNHFFDTKKDITYQSFMSRQGKKIEVLYSPFNLLPYISEMSVFSRH